MASRAYTTSRATIALLLPGGGPARRRLASEGFRFRAASRLPFAPPSLTGRLPEIPLSKPHDTLFRRAFGRTTNARDLLRTALPASIARAIDWRSLRRVDGTFVDKRLRRSHTDLLFTARAGNRRVLLYVLVEHKSIADRITVLQVLGYLHAIWTRYHREHPRARLLPPILPFVLHHGKRRSQSPTSLRALLDLRGVPPALVALQPDFRFVLDDLADQTEAKLQQRVGSTFAQLALLSMQHLRGADPATAEAVLRGWAGLTERLAAARNGQDDLLTLFSYILQIGCLPESRVNSVLDEITPRSCNTMLTTAQQMARRINRENGPKWLARGRTQGQAKLLLRQLEKKFGPLHKTVVARIRRARSEQLEHWADQILTAAKLDDVFTE